MKKKKRHAIPIDKSELLGQVAQMKRDGFRLVHICCTTLGDGYEITYSLLLIENVGNLVCPAEFKVGEDMKMMVLSISEGHDKPLKYPLMFQESSALVLNKIDLLPDLNTDLNKIRSDSLALNANLRIFEVSCVTGQGIDAWGHYLSGLKP